MSGDKPIVYWDTCVFLAWLKNEDRKPGQMAGIHSCVIEIDSGKWNLITSAITFAEVLEAKIGADVTKRFNDLFLRPNVTAINADIRVARLASELRGYYISHGETRRLATPDALHLATAILYDAEEFHTFDDGKINKKTLGLLELSGNVGGYRLIVVPPGTRQKHLDFEHSAQESLRQGEHLEANPSDDSDTATENESTGERIGRR